MSNIPAYILVDGSSYLYRAFHAMYKADLRTSDGRPTGAIRGVIAMLKKLQSDFPDSVIIVVFDAKGKTFRDVLYKDYKAQRPPMPDDLRSQVQPIHDIITAMGLPILTITGVEADDVIGTLAVQATERQCPILISTGDKDMAQLVNRYVTLVNTMTDTTLDIAGVNEKFGIPPERIIDYLALMGDKVDNIPGVPGIGEKTALALLQQIGGLTDLYHQLDAVTTLPIRGAKSVATKLANHRELAEISYQLATIKCDVELEKSLTDYHHAEVDNGALEQYYSDLEFNTWAKALQQTTITPQVTAPTPAPSQYDIILTEQQLDDWLAALKQAPLFALDTETTSLDYLTARIVGFSFAITPGHAAYLPLMHDYPGAPAQLDFEQTLTKLRPLLTSKVHHKVGQNLKYDRHVLLNHGIDLQGIAHDTMLQSYVLDSTATRHDMDSLAEKYLQRSTTHFEDIAGKGKNQLCFNQIDITVAGHYAAEDADITLQLHQLFWPKIAAQERLEQIYNELEIPLLTVINHIERQGVMIDSTRLKQQSQQLAETISQTEQQAHTLAEETFNLSSPKQLGAILYEKLGLPVLKKTPKGQASTAESVLQDLADDGYILPQLIMEYRSVSKLKSTYTDKLPTQINPDSLRVHTSYHQAVTATGRLSSSDPNLQNIPIRSEAGRKIREAFIASEGHTLVAADYSQIELRIMAHLSQDPNLLTAFSSGQDIHRHTAADIFSTPLNEVSTEQRRSAKAINFGLIYGMSAHGLSKQLAITRQQASDYMTRYFLRYPGVKTYMDTTREQAKQQGYVETVRGRRLYLADIHSRQAMRRQYAERTAINAPMQGTAADIIKQAMIDIHRWILTDNIPIKMIMQVHDELVFEVPDTLLDTVIPRIEQFMVQAASLSVPLEVSIGHGINWEIAH